MQLRIIDKITLGYASAYLHDAVFQRGQIQHDSKAKTLTMEVWRELWEQTISERFLLIFYRWKTPYIRCRLTFENVSTCQTKFTDELEHYQILHLQFDPLNNEIKIAGVCCFEIKLKVGSLEGNVTDLEERTTESFNKTTIGLTKFNRANGTDRADR